MSTPYGPQGHPDQPPPSGPPDPNQPTQAFGSPGHVPQAPPPQGPPQGPPPGLPSQNQRSQGQPSSGFPPRDSRPGGAPPQRAHQGPPQNPFQGPPQQGPPQQGPPQQGPPQGPFGPAPFGAPSHAGAARPRSANAIWALGLVSVVAVICGLSISEDGASAWSTVHAWGALAILGSVMTMATVGALGVLDAERAWQVAACGAGALVLFWVLFVLPAVGSNTSLVTTIGVAAGAVAVWIAPGRTTTPATPPDGPTDHSW